MVTTLPRIRPFQFSDANHFCRLFPPDKTKPASANQLKKLALSMGTKENDVFIPQEDWKREKFVRAGYTYFGQFIDHDLTNDKSPLPLPETTLEPDEIQNYRESFLCLDTLYGEGPHSAMSKPLYEEDGRYFRLGAALSNGHSFDVPLDNKCSPLTADPRNIENAIVRQIHAMFLQLHNKAVDEVDDFSAARERVQHQFQYVVLNDFLPQICNDTVLAALADKPNGLIDWNRGFSIPAEFAQAAFRFGHSMVRDEYVLGPGNGRAVELSNLFGGSASSGALATSLAVNWNNFLGSSLQPEYAHFIDTTIAEALFAVPIPSILGVFTTEMRLEYSAEQILPFRNLWRGAACRLCSGQIARELACPSYHINPPSCHYGKNDPWKYLKANHLGNHTPLWYYILLEAQLNEAGTRLGTLGSVIVAGTIAGALWSNPKSYLRKYGVDWRPECWQSPNDGKIQIKSLYDVARVVGLA